MLCNQYKNGLGLNMRSKIVADDILNLFLLFFQKK